MSLILAFTIDRKKSSVSSLVTQSYIKVHNNLLSRVNMGDTDLAAKLNEFMKHMGIRHSTLEEQMAKISTVVTKGSTGENSEETIVIKKRFGKQ